MIEPPASVADGDIYSDILEVPPSYTGKSTTYSRVITDIYIYNVANRVLSVLGACRTTNETYAMFIHIIITYNITFQD